MKRPATNKSFIVLVTILITAFLQFSSNTNIDDGFGRLRHVGDHSVCEDEKDEVVVSILMLRGNPANEHHLLNIATLR